MSQDKPPETGGTQEAGKPPDGREAATGAYDIADPAAFVRNMTRLAEEGGKLMAGLAGRTGGANGQTGPYSLSGELTEATKLFGAVASQWARDPAGFLEAQGRLATGFIDLWGRSVRRFLGADVEPLAEPDPGDARFRDPDWTQSQYFDFWKQAYLLTARWADEMVKKTQGLDEPTRKRAEFYLNQLSSALAPSNFVMFNPEVLRATLASNGENLVDGLRQLAEDLNASDNVLRVKQTDPDAFRVGENLAVTPGKVVFQNDIIQLIQYAPATEEVHATPLLIVPPWINKFYILDLVPQKSFIKWVVEQGFTVFVVSWVNPDRRLAARGFEDYMREGVLEAVGAVTDATGEKRINVLGYCVGGTLLGATLAFMAASGDERISAATFLTSQFDFSRAGDLMVFIDEAQLTALEAMMAEAGYLDGSRMAAVFNMLRPRDLIWPYVVNNYLLGKKPFPFDLLYWNSDSTRLPAANHAFYLREFYQRNRLARGELKLCGQTLDLRKVTVPVYELATREDHIAPAPSVYLGAKLFGGPVRYVLAGSGHIAGVVNPPERNKYQYWTGKKPTSKKHNVPTLDDWLQLAEEHAGSWWPDWREWLAKRSGDMVPARTPGDGKLKPIEDAPGSYVKVRIGAREGE